LFADAVTAYGEAIENANALVDDKWMRAELYANRASCHRRARNFRAAIADLDIALGLFPRYKRGHFRRGVCLLEAGLNKDAITALETLLGLDRDWPNIIDWLVRAHAAERRGGSTCSGAGGATSYSAPAFTEGGGWAEAAAEKDIASEKNHYSVLGVSQDATEKQLKRAYRVMSLKFHPDKEGGSTRAFQRIATAYETLTDPEKRQLYDDGADLKKKQGSNSDSDSDDEREQKSLLE
jgi:tetratricopeptide (TPR) repeat protein